MLGFSIRLLKGEIVIVLVPNVYDGTTDVSWNIPRYVLQLALAKGRLAGNVNETVVPAATRAGNITDILNVSNVSELYVTVIEGARK